MTTWRNRRLRIAGTVPHLPDLSSGTASGASIGEVYTRIREEAPEPGPEPIQVRVALSPPPEDRQRDLEPVAAPGNGIEPLPRRRRVPRFTLPARLAGMILIAEVIEICHRRPPSIEQTWELHAHHAEMWRQEHAPPPPVPTVDEWGMPVQVMKRQKAEPEPVPVKGQLGWPGKARYVWAGPHLALTAAIYAIGWLTDKPYRAIPAAALITLLWIRPW